MANNVKFLREAFEEMACSFLLCTCCLCIQGLVDFASKFALKALPVAQKGWLGEIHHYPVLFEHVLQGVACQADSTCALAHFQVATPLALLILYLMRFIGHNEIWSRIDEASVDDTVWR